MVPKTATVYLQLACDRSHSAAAGILHIRSFGPLVVNPALSLRVSSEVGKSVDARGNASVEAALENAPNQMMPPNQMNAPWKVECSLY
jgi:hypothetical protein